MLINKAKLLAEIGNEDGAIAIFEQVTDKLRMSKVAAHQNQAAVASVNKILRSIWRGGMMKVSGRVTK